jgi:flagellar hook-associated protein 2
MSSGNALQSISGLASGIDTSAIVSAMMSIAKQPEVAIQNKITVETARQNAYKGVLSELNDLTTSYQALTDVGTWAAKQSVSSSDQTYFTATSTGGAAAGSYTLSIANLAQANQYTSSWGTPGQTTASADDTISLTVGSDTTTIDVHAGDSLDTIANTINQTTGAPVYATIFNGNLVLSNKQTGTANAVTVTTGGTSGLSFAQNQAALDAHFTFNGTAGTSATNTVTNAIAGVTLNLKAATTSDQTLNVGAPAPDTDGITDKLNAFVTEYNKVLTDIQDRLSEQPVARPQTDADRTKGVLYGDQSLTRLLSQLRNAFSDPITSLTNPPSQYTSLSQVGLSTGAAVGTGDLNSDSIDGKLVVDTTKFSTALATNFDQVKALFTNLTGSYSTEGLGQRLNGILSPYTSSSVLGGYLNTSIDGETATISGLNSQVQDWETRLALKQQTLQAQFNAMETALSKTQSESASLSQSILSLSGG